MQKRLLQLLRTVQYLQYRQIFWRIIYTFYQPQVALQVAPFVAASSSVWQNVVPKTLAIHDERSAVFLHQSASIASTQIWNDSRFPKLWLYHLHYFHDLATPQSQTKKEIYARLIARWITENPAGHGNGWEPYPLSLRIVNWVKWHLQGNKLSPLVLESLWVQTQYLQKKIEWHLLANHVLANAKALVFAGVFFSGNKAEALLKKGKAVLFAQLDEQILADGGHFERSPMYHSIILEDLLDLIQLANVYQNLFSAAELSSLKKNAARMLSWLQCLTHPNGELAFFNDTTIGEAASLHDLLEYAKTFNLTPLKDDVHKINLQESGFVRLQKKAAVFLMDVGSVAPRYQPGHAHAETLSFEFSLHGERVLSNSGISTYAPEKQREHERSTAAHNTVVIDQENSSEVWAAFRVARRARCFDVQFQESVQACFVQASHDGYRRLKGKPTHTRGILLEDHLLSITDTVKGGFQSAQAYFHFHPGIHVALSHEAVELILPSGRHLQLKWTGARAELSKSEYHRAFGLSEQRHSLMLHFLSAQTKLEFYW